MPIAMAYVDPETARLAPAAAEGSALAVDIRGNAEPARMVALPFYRRAE
jgi:aminomethyltransferase